MTHAPLRLDPDRLFPADAATRAIARRLYEDLAAAVQVLNRAAGRLRHGVGRVLSLRYLPELHFQADEELRTGDRLGALIRTAVREDDVHARTRGDDAPAVEPDAE